MLFSDWKDWTKAVWADLEETVIAVDARMEPMSTSAADRTVSHDTGWVSDGHHIAWNGQHGAFMGHTDECPYYVQNKMRIYCCSPGFYANEYGITLDDLPPDHAAACREFPMGTEPIRWRLQEHIHPDLTVHEQNQLASFSVELDSEDE